MAGSEWRYSASSARSRSSAGLTTPSGQDRSVPRLFPSFFVILVVLSIRFFGSRSLRVGRSRRGALPAQRLFRIRQSRTARTIESLSPPGGHGSVVRRDLCVERIELFPQTDDLFQLSPFPAAKL